MKKNDTLTWRRLLRTVVVMAVILGMLLCGCNQGGSNDGEKETKPGSDLALGNGKLEAQDAVDGFTTIYGSLLSALGGNQKAGFGTQMNMDITLGEEVLEGIRQSLEASDLKIDMDWFEKLGLQMDVAYADDRMQYAIVAGLNGQSVVSMDMIMDMMTNSAYVGLPELNDSYLKGEMEITDPGAAMAPAGLSQMMKEYSDVVNVLPTEKALRTLLTRYLKIALDNLEEPTITTVTLSAEGISQEVTAATYTIMRSDVLDIATAVMTTAKTDTELEKMIDTFCDWYKTRMSEQAGSDLSELDMHQMMLDGIEDALAELEEAKTNLEDAPFLTFENYTSNDKQVGLRLAVNNVTETVAVYGYSLTSGKDTAFVMDLAGEILLAGKGTLDGNKASGNYTLQIQSEDVLYLELKDIDTAALDQGDLNGTLRLQPTEAFLENVVSGNAMLSGADIVLEMKMDVTAKKSTIEYKLYLNDIFTMGIKNTTKEVSVNQIKLPANTVDANDPEAVQIWAQNMDLNAVLNNLKKAGVPKELMDLLEMSINGG